MRAQEFIIERKKRRKKKSLKAALWGPGPYGMYGVNTGYSGDSGSSVGESLDEGWKDWVVGAAMGAASLGANAEIVKVMPGQTVYSIAKAFGTTPEVIQKLNKLDKNFTVKAGQEIKVPDPKIVDAPSKKKPTVKPEVKPEVKPVTKKIDTSKTLTGTVHEVALTKAAKEAGITDPIELAAFLAQTAHESHNFKSMVEYGGRSYFKKYEPVFRKDKKTGKLIIDPKTGKPKHFNPKADELGNDFRGDGIRYKGRGYIQITGRDNYKRVGQRIGVDLVNNPELAEKPEIAAKVAIMYWKLRTRPEVNDFNDVRAVTKTINSGLKGLEDRKELFQDFKKFKLASA